MKKLLLLALSFVLTGCHGYPEAITPVEGFEIERYLGKWYEIARLDHSFERDLEKVSADYTLRDDGGVDVINRGFSMKKNTWKEAVGKAYFVKSATEGYLKVSFFGPFYSSYVIFELDTDDYQYAFVSGFNESYLWLLSRTPVVSDELKAEFISMARERGFSTDEIIWVAQ